MKKLTLALLIGLSVLFGSCSKESIYTPPAAPSVVVNPTYQFVCTGYIDTTFVMSLDADRLGQTIAEWNYSKYIFTPVYGWKNIYYSGGYIDGNYYPAHTERDWEFLGYQNHVISEKCVATQIY